MSPGPVLVPAAGLLTDPGPVVLLDVRWALGDDRGRERYREGHLPGAKAPSRGSPRACEG